jgi:hypothetical protein
VATTAAKIETDLGPGTSAAVPDASGDGRHVVEDVVSPSFAEAESTMQRRPAVSKAPCEELSNDHSGRTYASCYRGVSQARNGRWSAQLMRAGKPTRLGSFDDEAEAARAYDKMWLWCDKHGAGEWKRDIKELNFGKDAYKGDLAYLQHVSHDDLVAALRAEGRRRPSTSSYRGVTLLSNGQWVVTFTRAGKSTRLGSFDDEAEAARAYDKMWLWCDKHGAGEWKRDIKELNFGKDAYEGDLAYLQHVSHDDLVAALRAVGRRRPSTSSYRGVTLLSNGRWVATFTRAGKSTRLGTFDDEAEAARAYDKMWLWCDKHGAGEWKRDIKELNFDKDAYEGDLAYLQHVSQDNLVVALRAEGWRRPSISSYRGVTHLSNGRWQVTFARAGKTTYLGSFDDEAEAARAYDKMWLWCDKHGAGEWKRDIKELNFGKDAYKGDLAYLQNVSHDDLVAALRAVGRRRPSTSCYRGVAHLSNGRWQVTFARAGKFTHLGRFDDEAEAARAYDKMWLWRDKHDGADGRKRDIKELNFDKDAYEGDLAYLQHVSHDNLVVALQAEGRRRSSTSSYRGVTLLSNGRWVAKFARAGKTTHLGRFDDEAEAARAYDKMWLWCYLHDGADGRKRNINELNFDKDAYEGDLAYLQHVSHDDLVAALRAVGRRRPSTSSYRGVTLLSNGRWVATFTRAGKITYLGAFDEEAEAARAWDKMQLWWEVHGEGESKVEGFTNLNRAIYSGDLAYLQRVSQDDLVAALRAEGRRRPSTSSYRGVTLLSNGRWVATFTRAGKSTRLGRFDDEAEAARAYDKMWLWCYLHDGADGRKRNINELNFDKDAYEGDLAYLQHVSHDDLVAALRAVGRRRPSTSSYRGVTLLSNGRWVATFTRAGKITYLGAFDEEAEAARAWDKMQLWWEVHGEGESKVEGFTNLNRAIYSGDLAYLQRVSQDDLVAALRAEGRRARLATKANGGAARWAGQKGGSAGRGGQGRGRGEAEMKGVSETLAL